MRHVIAALLILLLACDEKTDVTAYLGVTDRDLGTPPTIDILVDHGSNAPGTPENLDLVVSGILSQVARRPGSTVRGFWCANTVGESKLISAYVVPPPAKPNLRAREAHAKAVIADGSRRFHEAAAPFFADFHRKTTPLIETIARIALAGNPTGGDRVILAVTDLREESELFGRFECDALPSRDAFLASVATVLPKDSLQGATVYAVFAAPDSVDGDRCPVRIARFRAITQLFAAAIEQAGGRFLLSPTSIPQLERKSS